MAKIARQTEVSDYDVAAPQAEQQSKPKLLTDSQAPKAESAPAALEQEDYKAKLTALEQYLLHLDKKEMLVRSMLKDVLSRRKVTLGKMKALMDENQAMEKMPLLRQMIGIS